MVSFYIALQASSDVRPLFISKGFAICPRLDIVQWTWVSVIWGRDSWALFLFLLVIQTESWIQEFWFFSERAKIKYAFNNHLYLLTALPL